MARLDPHSYCDSDHPRVASFRWRARVDFAARVLDCEVTLVFAEEASGALSLDTRDLDIESVTRPDGGGVTWSLMERDAILGQELRLQLASNTRSVRVVYRTSPEASALQWLEPAQTAGNRSPFLFSQCQAIHARSVIPCQDTPTARVRFHAELEVPSNMRGLMAAAQVSRRDEAGRVVEVWHMPQPVPPYLVALAVGDLEHRDVGPRTRVWAEAEIIEEAAWEFEDTERLIQAGEALFGPYDWDRFDVLVMPPSFPYGGMENPRLTFVTPTLLAGDRSQIAVIAHELAHSWTGNLITNASAEHFWLNEGWTRYAELRIIEAVYGPDVAALHLAAARSSLDEAVARFEGQGRPELTKLRTSLEGIDPDDAFSAVPYEKGLLFLRALEKQAGRDAWNDVVRAYIDRFRFGVITTEEFMAFVEDQRPGLLASVNADEWVHGVGVPDSAEVPASARLEAVRALGDSVPETRDVADWTPLEWQLYLEQVRPASLGLCQDLDERFDLTSTGNHEILEAWLRTALGAGYPPARVRALALVGEVGRMKYLRPLYEALAADTATREQARAAFERHEASYHPIARQLVRGLVVARP